MTIGNDKEWQNYRDANTESPELLVFTDLLGATLEGLVVGQHRLLDAETLVSAMGETLSKLPFKTLTEDAKMFCLQMLRDCWAFSDLLNHASILAFEQEVMRQLQEKRKKASTGFSWTIS